MKKNAKQKLQNLLSGILVFSISFAFMILFQTLWYAKALYFQLRPAYLITNFAGSLIICFFSYFLAKKAAKHRINSHYESELHFKDLINHSPNILYKYSSKRGAIFWSERVRDILGYEPEELKTDPFKWTNAIHSEDIQAVKQAITDNEKGKDFDIQYRIQAQKGNWIWLHDRFMHKSTIGDEIFIEGIAVDITEQKKAEEALKFSQALYADLVETAQDLIWQCDAQGRYTYLNPAWEDVFGYKIGEMLGKKFTDFQTVEWAYRDSLTFNQLLHGSTIKGLETVHLAKDGSEINLVFNAKYIVDNHRNVIGTRGTAFNITDRKRADEAIRVSEMRLKRAEIASKSGNWELHLNTQTIFASDGAIKLYGVDKDKFEYAFVKNIPLPEYRQMLDLALKKLMFDNVPYDVEFKIKTVDTGEIKDIHSVAVFDPEKRILFGIIQDITDRKQTHDKLVQLNQQLQELNAAKDKLFSIIGHDLKSPFNLILGYISLLLENLHIYDFVKIEKQLKIINEVSQNTYNLLDNLLMWGKSQSNKISISTKSVNFLEICQQVIDNINNLATSKSIVINCFAEDEIYLSADHNMLETILRNLISNAIKFTHKNGRINIYAEKNQSFVHISVADNGVGMSDEIKNKLFRIDTNVSTHGTDNEIGTGLGLLICKDFVEKQGGKIWVKSEVNKGSEFIFSLPLSLNI